MNLNWFDDIKAVLGPYYDPAFPADTVGFLRGSNQPHVWRSMDATGSGQMIVLGNRPPTGDDWIAAGVPHRSGDEHEIKLGDLAGFVVIYGGFIRRPWGHIVVPNKDVWDRGFPGSLNSWKRNFLPPR